MDKEYMLELEMAFDKVIEHLKNDFSRVRTGRASANMLDAVKVEAYGNLNPINAVALVTVPEARQLLIKPFDKSLIGSIDKAIVSANLGFTPTNNGETLRITIPALTEETRKAMVKDVKSIAENNKVAIRNARQKAMDQVKKASDLNEDAKKGLENDVQTLTNKYNKMIEEVTKEKEQEVMTI